MSSKVESVLRAKLDAIVYAGGGLEGEEQTPPFSLLAALNTNIRESFDEIEMLRGTIQYWESRRAATEEKERSVLVEAFRIMHGELLGLTVRMKELLTRTELASS